MKDLISLKGEITRLENIIKATNIGTWEWEVQTGKVVFNEIWANTIGYTLKELSPISIDTWIENCHPEDYKKANDYLSRVFNKELDFYELEIRMKHKNGDWVWILDKGEVISWSEDGKPLIMFGSHTNISKIKEVSFQLEKSLIETTKSEKIFKDLYEKAPVGYQSLDINGDFILVNKAYADLLGYEVKEMIGKNFGDFMDESSASILPEQFSDFVMSGKVDVIFQMVHKDKHIIDVQFIGQIVLDINGEFKQTHCILFDVTEILKYQQTLKDSQEKLELILNSTSEAIYGVDETEKCTFVNKAFLNMTGYEEDEVLGKSMHKLIHHSYEDGTHYPIEECDMMNAFYDGKVCSKEDIIWKKDGTFLVVMYTSNPQIKDNNIIGAVFTFDDISERKLTENILKFEHEKAQKYLDIMGVMLIVLNTKGEITLINNKGCEILGLKESELLGKNWFDNFIPKDIVNDVKIVFRDVFDKEKELTSHYENTILTSSGEERIINWYNTILYDDKKNIIGILSSGEDITKRLEAEKSLKESIRQNEALINAMPDILFILNRDGVILDYRAQESTILYEEPEIFIGKNMKDVLPKDIGDKFESQFKELNNTEKILTLEYSLLLDGKTRYFEARSISSGSDQIICIVRDISDLKEKELELEYSAYNDYLTGLHNRRYFEEKLAELDIVDNFPISVIMGDINGLKLINDAFGHLSGDKLLISASNLIADNCRENDLLARIGGDEFAIVMPKTSEKEVEIILKSIKNKAKLIETQSIPLSISFGHKTKTIESDNIRDVYRSAEDLMYREKLLEIPSMRSGAIETILSTLYEKDVKSELHSRSVSQLSERIAIAYGMNRQDVAEVKTAGLLHDIGKIIISSDIINKKGKLTVEEYSTMKNHPEIGFRILNSTSDMREISNIVLNHHERCDGKGYPRGIKGEEIPIKARIIAIADAFDAMTSERTYKDTISKEEALKEIMENAGTQFNLEIVEVFRLNFDDITIDF